VLFEFGFGHWVAGHSWRRLLADYKLLAGRLWALVLVWIGIAPWVFYRLGPEPDRSRGHGLQSAVAGLRSGGRETRCAAREEVPMGNVLRSRSCPPAGR